LQQRRKNSIFLSKEKSNFQKFTDWILAINKNILCLVAGGILILELSGISHFLSHLSTQISQTGCKTYYHTP
jgi:hypothetical protein